MNDRQSQIEDAPLDEPIAADGAGTLKRGPLVDAAASRPVLTSVIGIVGIATLCAVAYRQAPRAAVIENLSLAAALWAGVGAPLLIALLVPKSGIGRLLCGVLVFGLAVAAPLIAGSISAPPWIGSIAQIGFFLCTALIVLSPLTRPDIALSQLPVLSVLIGLAAYLAYVDVANISAGAFVSAEPAIAVVGVALGLQAVCFFLSRFTTHFARGGDNRTAVAKAMFESSPYAAFVVLSAAALFALSIEASAPWSPAAAGFVVAGTLAPVMAGLCFGGAIIAIGTYRDPLARAENLRASFIHDLLTTRLRPISPTSSALAAMGILGIVAVVGAVERIPTAPPMLLAAGPLLGITVALSFFSLRAGLLFGTMTLTLWLGVDWISGFLGWRLPPMQEAAALLVGVGAVAPVTLFWREQRSPWRKAREVMLRAIASALAPMALGGVLSIAALATASATGYWPEGLAVAGKASIYLLFGAGFSAVWAAGFGAILGREL